MVILLALYGPLFIVQTLSHSLYVKTTGVGPELVLLHGWGAHSGIWQDLLPELTPYFRIHCVDLPGYGQSRAIPMGSLIDVVNLLRARFSGPVSVLGWSFGGLVAMQWALSVPYQIRKLVLVATSPCFMQQAGWQHAMRPNVMRSFAKQLEISDALALRRFLALQTLGLDQHMAAMKHLNTLLGRELPPNTDALKVGLALLMQTDLRDTITRITQPSLLIYGAHDALVPSEAGHRLNTALPNARLHCFADAAHVPFVSHPGMFSHLVRRFFDEN